MVVSPASKDTPTTVRLGALRAQVEAAAAATGVGPSTWIRDLVQREVAANPPVTPTEAPVEPSASEGGAVYRAWLPADLTAQLDMRKQRDGFRSRAAVLRALIAGVGITSSASGSDATSEARHGGSERSTTLLDSLGAVGASNHQLVAIARHLGNIAKTMREGTGGTRVIDRMRLEEALIEVNSHIKVASQLLGDLRPLLKRASK